MTGGRLTLAPTYSPKFTAGLEAAEATVADFMRDLARRLAELEHLYRSAEHGTEADRQVYLRQLGDLKQWTEFDLAVAFALARDAVSQPWRPA